MNSYYAFKKQEKWHKQSVTRAKLTNATCIRIQLMLEVFIETL